MKNTVLHQAVHEVYGMEDSYVHMSSGWDPYTIHSLAWLNRRHTMPKQVVPTSITRNASNHSKHPGRRWPFHPFHPFPPLLALDFCFPLWGNDLRAAHWRPATQCHATITASSKTWGGCHGYLPRRLAQKHIWQWWEVLLDRLCIKILEIKSMFSMVLWYFHLQSHQIQFVDSRAPLASHIKLVVFIEINQHPPSLTNSF